MEIKRSDLITVKEGYEAMIHLLKTYYETTDSNDLTDILSGGEYWRGEDTPADSAFWEYWTEAIHRVKKDGPLYKELH